MKNKQTLSNQERIILAAEYRYLTTLPFLPEPEAERLMTILEVANYDKSLDYLIEEIETIQYVRSMRLDDQLEGSSRWKKGLQRLHKLVSVESHDLNGKSYLTTL
jgi:uncharacterized protein YfbU (UPF0304 family)